MKLPRIMALVGWIALCGVAAAQEDPVRSQELGKVRDRLASMRITLDFRDAKLEEVISYFQEYSGLNFHLDAGVAKEGQEPARVTLKVRDVTLKTALKLVLNPRDLACVYRDGILLVAPKSKMASFTVTRVYDVRDLLFKLEDFPGPKIDLDQKKSGTLWELPVDEPVQIIREDFLMDLIKTSTGDRSWDDSTITSIDLTKTGLLVVSQSKAIHEEVRRLLDLLRQYK